MNRTSFDRVFYRMTKPWVVISYGLLIAVSFLYLDKPLTLWCQSLDWGASRVVFKGLTLLGCKTMYVVGLPVFAVILHYVKHQTWACRTWFLWLCVGVPNAVAGVLKIIFGRARPELLFKIKAYGFQWMQLDHAYHSFPSGHTITIMGLVFGLWVMIPRYRWFYLALGVAVGLSRIVLLQHYLSDVLTAAYLACIVVWGLTYLMQRFTPKFMENVHG